VPILFAQQQLPDGKAMLVLNTTSIILGKSNALPFDILNNTQFLSICVSNTTVFGRCATETTHCAAAAGQTTSSTVSCADERCINPNACRAGIDVAPASAADVCIATAPSEACPRIACQSLLAGWNGTISCVGMLDTHKQPPRQATCVKSIAPIRLDFATTRSIACQATPQRCVKQQPKRRRNSSVTRRVVSRHATSWRHCHRLVHRRASRTRRRAAARASTARRWWSVGAARRVVASTALSRAIVVAPVVVSTIRSSASTALRMLSYHI
jgi:hypothetical protein